MKIRDEALNSNNNNNSEHEIAQNKLISTPRVQRTRERDSLFKSYGIKNQYQSQGDLTTLFALIVFCFISS